MTITIFFLFQFSPVTFLRLISNTACEYVLSLPGNAVQCAGTFTMNILLIYNLIGPENVHKIVLLLRCQCHPVATWRVASEMKMPCPTDLRSLKNWWRRLVNDYHKNCFNIIQFSLVTFLRLISNK